MVFIAKSGFRKDTSAKLWCVRERRNDIANDLWGLGNPADATLTARGRPKAEQYLNSRSSLCLRQKPGAGGWKKEKAKAREGRQRLGTLRGKTLNGWSETWGAPSSIHTPRLPWWTYPLRQRVSTPCHPDKTRNLPCLPLEPSGPDCLLPLAETPQTPRPMVTRNHRGWEHSMSASGLH